MKRFAASGMKTSKVVFLKVLSAFGKPLELPDYVNKKTFAKLKILLKDECKSAM